MKVQTILFQKLFRFTPKRIQKFLYFNVILAVLNSINSYMNTVQIVLVIYKKICIHYFRSLYHRMKAIKEDVTLSIKKDIVLHELKFKTILIIYLVTYLLNV